MRFLLLIALIHCLSCQRAPEKQAIWSTNGWPVSSPAAQGMDGTLLKTLDQKFEKGDYGYVDHTLIIRHGHVVYDKGYTHNYDQIAAGRDTSTSMYNYYNPNWHPYYKRGTLHTMQSVTKTVTSAIMGIAFGRKQLPGVDTQIIKYFDDYEIQQLDDRKRRLTLENLLTMRAGFDWDEVSYSYSDLRNNCAAMENSADWVKYVIDRPMAHEPGTVFVYSSGASQLFSHIMKKATGAYIDEYAEQYLFKPLGISEYYWKRTPTKLPDTEGGLYLTPHDLAKIGYLYLQDGVWEGEQLIPSEWVRASLQFHVKAERPDDVTGDWGYGYQWWLLPVKGATTTYAYTMTGYGGQRLFMLPEADLIAVFTGWNIFETGPLPTEVFYDFILKAVK
jgi:CubicO group peptidase (beta-lactamase class C family)